MCCFCGGGDSDRIDSVGGVDGDGGSGTGGGSGGGGGGVRDENQHKITNITFCF